MGKPVCMTSHKWFEASDLYFEFYFERKPWARFPVVENGWYTPPQMKWEPALVPDDTHVPRFRWVPAERKYNPAWVWKGKMT